MTSIIRRLALAGVAAIFAAGGAAAQEVTEINFGIISTESTQNLRPQWEPFLADMEEATGLKVNPFFASDYAGIIEGMRFGKVQVAWYGNKAAMEAVDRASGEVFVQTVDINGNPGYWSLLLAHKDSPINSLEDVLKCDGTLNFGIGDPNSTSGFLVPMTFVFAANGVDPRECFKTVRNANHETNALAVANKQVDVAANNTENLARIEANNPKAFEQIKVIWRSPLIPADPIVWRTDLPQETKDKIKTFFLTYGTEDTTGDVAAEREVLARLAWAAFRDSNNDQLLPIRIMELGREIAQVEADTSLSEADKAAKLADLEAQKKVHEDRLAEVQSKS